MFFLFFIRFSDEHSHFALDYVLASTMASYLLRSFQRPGTSQMPFKNPGKSLLPEGNKDISYMVISSMLGAHGRKGEEAGTFGVFVIYKSRTLYLVGEEECLGGI